MCGAASPAGLTHLGCTVGRRGRSGQVRSSVISIGGGGGGGGRVKEKRRQRQAGLGSAPHLYLSPTSDQARRPQCVGERDSAGQGRAGQGRAAGLCLKRRQAGRFEVKSNPSSAFPPNSLPCSALHFQTATRTATVTATAGHTSSRPALPCWLDWLSHHACLRLPSFTAKRKTDRVRLRHQPNPLSVSLSSSPRIPSITITITITPST